MSVQYFNHAFTIAFEAVSAKELDCRADDMLAGLKARVQEMEEDLALPDSHPGYSDDAPKGKRMALLHEATGMAYDVDEMTEEEMLDWKRRHNLPVPDMSLDEAITHARHVAGHCDNEACAAQHSQLAEWLEELVRLRKEQEDGDDAC